MPHCLIVVEKHPNYSLTETTTSIGSNFEDGKGNKNNAQEEASKATAMTATTEHAWHST
jgi:hypothetical protein